MTDYRQSLRDAVRESQGDEEVEEDEHKASERVARQLRENVVWPEKRFEVKRQRAMNEVREEANDAG